ncbi:uncharacterized protein KY384_005815 [Bacidia gigantensis]|uniref:uncharacterized protein n=1 Tax=Bacidia gigantensis TaxID=2732470 RepID=UPI001D03E8BC|nr:uncharacterized protein KY384_005815 [Bacidia gigantensis]KAG8529180.1 hypothetical protein KY384_005815 [Bacidia gigantensis]
MPTKCKCPADPLERTQVHKTRCMNRAWKKMDKINEKMKPTIDKENENLVSLEAEFNFDLFNKASDEVLNQDHLEYNLKGIELDKLDRERKDGIRDAWVTFREHYPDTHVAGLPKWALEDPPADDEANIH